MKIAEFDFDMPKSLIANSPARPRHNAKLMIYNRENNSLEEGHFFDLPNYLNENDVLVFNNSKVFPARLLLNENDFEKEILFLNKEADLWKVIVRPGKKFRPGDNFEYDVLKGQVVKIDNYGYRHLKINLSDSELYAFLERNGAMPIPPYIKGEEFENNEYNTVYSSKVGSVAAPTAGLHFTDELIARLLAKGVKIEYVTLHVGLGTFLPVKTENLDDHKMHEEVYEIDFGTAGRLNKYMYEGKRIIAVGTTTIRTLESNFLLNNSFQDGVYETSIFIKPGYKWKVVKGVITNFHLPKSTLLVLVAAFIGKSAVEFLYKRAVSRRYRFFSFGDGMLLL